MTASPPHADRGWPGSLDWGGDWLRDAGRDLAHLGFVLRDGAQPGTVPGPRLLVALRAAPTLQHFDPEEATFWSFQAGRGSLASLTRETAAKAGLPIARPFSWGRIRLTDRVPVANQFLSFGGSLLVDLLDEQTIVAAFVSRAPILRWAGHSQGVDPFVDEIGSFFARLMVPIDFQPGAEALIGECGPEVLYAAAIRYADNRLNRVTALRDADPALDAAVNHEVHRLVHDSPAAWAEAARLLESVELA